MDPVVSVGSIQISAALLITLLTALVGGVWKMSSQLTKIQNVLEKGEARMNRHEKLLANHARRLNKLDNGTDPIGEDE